MDKGQQFLVRGIRLCEVLMPGERTQLRSMRRSLQHAEKVAARRQNRDDLGLGTDDVVA